MKTIFYIDGYNLYYSLLYGSKYKWLDLFALARRLQPKHEVIAVKYFTAKIQAKDHDPKQPQRQSSYLRSLKTIEGIEVIEGHYKREEKRMPLCQKEVDGTRKLVSVIRHSEKGSDVNLASHLLMDGFSEKYEIASVITNDEDLKTPMRMVREMGFPLALFSPSNYHNNKLKGLATYLRRVRLTDAAKCQLPEKLKDHKGRELHKPGPWSTKGK